MGEVQKAAFSTSLPGDSGHTDCGEPLLQKREVITDPAVLPSRLSREITDAGPGGEATKAWMLVMNAELTEEPK